MEEADKAGYEISDEIQKVAEETKKALMEKGVKIIPTSDVDLEAFKAAGAKAYDVLGVSEAKDALLKALGK